VIDRLLIFRKKDMIVVRI